MKKILLLLWLAACTGLARAQYCPMHEGRELHYTSRLADGSTLHDTLRVTLREETPDRLAVDCLSSKGAYGNSHAYVYHRDTGVTDRILMDASKEEPFSVRVDNSTEEGRKTEEEMRKLLENTRSEGRIVLSLSPGMKEGRRLPLTGKYTVKVYLLNAKVTAKGTYEGEETLTTPAGTFRCAKVEYRLRTTFVFLPEVVRVTEWYAPGVGLVKSVEQTKSGERLKTVLLTAVRR